MRAFVHAAIVQVMLFSLSFATSIAFYWARVHFAHIASLSGFIGGNLGYHMFLVTNWSGRGPVATGDEHVEIRWFSIQDAANLPLAHPSYVGLLKNIESGAA